MPRKISGPVDAFLYHDPRNRIARRLRKYINSQQYAHVVMGLQRPTMQAGILNLRHLLIVSIVRSPRKKDV